MELLSKTEARSMPEELYHYTSQEGFLGILQSGVLWCSNLLYLNDTEEFNLARRLMLRQLEALPGREGSEGALVERMADKLNHLSSGCSYVCSFSDDSDSLEMWRAYGGGRTAYAIGFDPALIASANPGLQLYLGRCLYGEEEQHRCLAGVLLEKITELGVNSKTLEPEEALKQTLRNTNNLFLKYAPFIKDDAFEQEREWRITMPPIHDDEKGLGCHGGRSTLVPHYGLRVRTKKGRLAIKSVVVGPCPHKRLAADAVLRVLYPLVESGFSVGESALPYRNW